MQIVCLFCRSMRTTYEVFLKYGKFCVADMPRISFYDSNVTNVGDLGIILTNIKVLLGSTYVIKKCFVEEIKKTSEGEGYQQAPSRASYYGIGCTTNGRDQRLSIL